LPIGYWKGSAMAVMLDAVASVLSGGRSSLEIGREPAERTVSQVFIAVDASRLGNPKDFDRVLDAIVADLNTAAPASEGDSVRYPGEGMLRARKTSEAEGVLVDEENFAALAAM
jgi:3-dehydro-L-gulonate 2-dehydrogenase